MITNEVKGFSRFQEENPDWKSVAGVYKRDSETLQRLPMKWTEEGVGEHEYHAGINVKTGEIYLDCRKRKIFTKCLFLTFFRPIHTCVLKTAWHLSIIGPLVAEIISIAAQQKEANAAEGQAPLSGGQIAKRLVVSTGQSLLDILRTPLYGIAMTIVYIAGVVIAPFSPNSLYRVREYAGFLERRMLRVQDIFDGGGWVLTPCFNPMLNISTVFVEGNDFSWFARSQIGFRRSHRALFNDCLRLFSHQAVYKSAAAF